MKNLNCGNETKPTPEGCTPERIRECHGDFPGHPCLKRGDVI